MTFFLLSPWCYYYLASQRCRYAAASSETHTEGKTQDQERRRQSREKKSGKGEKVTCQNGKRIHIVVAWKSHIECDDDKNESDGIDFRNEKTKSANGNYTLFSSHGMYVIIYIYIEWKHEFHEKVQDNSFYFQLNSRWIFTVFFSLQWQLYAFAGIKREVKWKDLFLWDKRHERAVELNDFHVNTARE